MVLPRHTALRLVAVCLLLLAASPLTAPFAAGSPLDLFGGSAHLQAKKAPDDMVAASSTSSDGGGPIWNVRPVRDSLAVTAPDRPAPRDFPLRL